MERLVRYSRVLAIVGDILQIQVPKVGEGKQAVARLGDLAIVEERDGRKSLAQVINIVRDVVSLQVFSGTKGVSTAATVTFLGHPMQTTYSPNILGRVFTGTGEPRDAGPDLSMDPKVDIGGPTVNPAERIVPTKMIRTDVPMIDIFNTLVESQKIP
ncbi:MAG: V-type ATP synthase subunit B, partial [Gammaproteobacteria bacterium]|nr:V-type ATP synthase subunit B [Gammaproteobacteria bacterium]